METEASNLPKRRTLFEIEKDALAIEQKLIEQNGELSAELEAQFNAIQTELEDKSDAYAVIMRRLETTEEYFKSRAQEYDRVNKSIGVFRENLKDRIKRSMLKMEKPKIEGQDFTFSVSRIADKLELDESLLSNDFKMVVSSMVPDKEKILAHLKLGEPVLGATLKTNYSLRISLSKKKGLK